MKVLFALCAAVLLFVSAAALDVSLTDDIVAGYADAFERFQVKFDKHYATPEEYRLRLRAYAVC